MMEPFMVNMQYYGPRESEYTLSVTPQSEGSMPLRMRAGERTVRVWLQGNWLIHRTGGPALEYSDGEKFWYKSGKRLSKKVRGAIPFHHTPYWEGGFIGFWCGGGKAMPVMPMSVVGRFPMGMSVMIGEDRA